jgi:hypothetical protein
MNDQDIRNRIVRKMLRKEVIGDHKKQIDTVVNTSGLPTHAHGKARELLEEMASDPDAPIESYGGGHRQNVRLVSAQRAVKYLKEHGGDVPFGYD